MRVICTGAGGHPERLIVADTAYAYWPVTCRWCGRTLARDPDPYLDGPITEMDLSRMPWYAATLKPPARAKRKPTVTDRQQSKARDRAAEVAVLIAGLTPVWRPAPKGRATS